LIENVPKSRSRLRIVAAAALLAAALGLALVPYHQETLVVTMGDLGNHRVELHDRCRPALLGALGHDDSGWFGYAPNTGVAYAPHRDCALAARFRLGVAVLLLGGGTGLVLGWVRRRLVTPP